MISKRDFLGKVPTEVVQDCISMSKEYHEHEELCDRMRHAFDWDHHKDEMNLCKSVVDLPLVQSLLNKCNGVVLTCNAAVVNRAQNREEVCSNPAMWPGRQS